MKLSFLYLEYWGSSVNCAIIHGEQQDLLPSYIKKMKIIKMVGSK